MINRNKQDSQQQQSRGRSRSNAGRIPYLKVENVNFDHRLATVLSTRMEDDNFKPNGPQVLSVKIAFAGNTYLWTLRSNNPNLDILADAFGDDETKWVGKEFNLFLETDQHTNNNMIRAEVVSTKTASSKRG